MSTGAEGQGETTIKSLACAVKFLARVVGVALPCLALETPPGNGQEIAPAHSLPCSSAMDRFDLLSCAAHLGRLNSCVSMEGYAPEKILVDRPVVSLTINEFHEFSSS
jgi:hypothetical protein